MPEKNEKSVHEESTEIGIVNAVWARARGQLDREIDGFQMEMIRRNNVALRAFNASSDRWAKTLVGLTVALIVFTLVLIYLTWELLQHEA